MHVYISWKTLVVTTGRPQDNSGQCLSTNTDVEKGTDLLLALL